MKKFTIIILFCTAFLPLMAQFNYLTVQGYVTDTNSGAPIANHAVTIQTDSAAGFHYDVVYTGSSGFYVDTVVLNSGTFPTGNLFVSTLDCNQNNHMVTLVFGPGNQAFTVDFQICNSAAPCIANYTYAFLGNLDVQFTDLSMGGTFTYNWQFGDGTGSTLHEPLHTYAASGWFTTSLTVTDSSSACSDIKTMVIHVGDSTGGCQAMYYAVPDTGNTLNVQFFDQSTGNNIASWLWDFGDGNSATIIFPASPNVSHSYAVTGTYYVCLTIQSNDSTCYSTYCDTLTVGNSGGCQAQFTWYSDSLNNGPAIHFVDLSTNAYSWSWDFGDNYFSGDQNPVHNYSQQGTYYVCLTIYNQDWSCQSTWCANVTIGNNSDCENYFTFSQNALTVAFIGHMVNGLPATYTWSFGDGSGGSRQNATHTYSSQGMYFVSLTTTTDSTNCTYTSGQTIQVGDSSQFNQIYGQVMEGNFPLSSGLVMIFSLDTLNTLPYYDLSVIDSAGIYSFQYVPQGNFVVWAIPTDSSGYLPTYYGDVIMWQQATVISLGVPNNPYKIHLVMGTSGSNGQGGINGQINTNGLKSGLSDKIRMILMNEQGNPLEFRNVSSSGAFDFSTLGYGIYFLRAELPGCTSDIVRVELTQDKPIVNIVMTYSGNHLLGVNENESLVSGLTAYPNPVTDMLNLSIVSKKNATVVISLRDFTGREVKSESSTLVKGINTIRVNTAALQPGMFLLRITSTDGTNIIRKVIKGN
ncbi:MAG: PKD domain-containing protein [Bacteroidetes bacterium]|nr:PKD domain-containing protein [Bacteroidota bacterium]